MYGKPIGYTVHGTRYTVNGTRCFATSSTVVDWSHRAPCTVLPCTEIQAHCKHQNKVEVGQFVSMGVAMRFFLVNSKIIRNFAPQIKTKAMTVISSRTFSESPIHYLNLAARERIAVKRGKMLFQITPQPQVESISPSGDPYWDDPRNVAELDRRLKLRKEGKLETFVLTPELQKEWFGV